MIRLLSAVMLALALAVSASAQSQAANGPIEGTVVGTSGAVLPGVAATVTNAGTGARRMAVTNDVGIFRVMSLPLGTDQVVAELQGFKKYQESGPRLTQATTQAQPGKRPGWFKRHTVLVSTLIGAAAGGTWARLKMGGGSPLPPRGQPMPPGFSTSAVAIPLAIFLGAGAGALVGVVVVHSR